jgi:hypothetical protein
MARTTLENGALKVVLGAVLGLAIVCTVALVPSLVSHFSSSNPDGTSKAAVYTKISDFGNYSQWAQKQLQQGFSMCEVQNALAKNDTSVSFVADCSSSGK